MPNFEQTSPAAAYDIEAARAAFPIKTISVTPAGRAIRSSPLAFPATTPPRTWTIASRPFSRGSKYAPDVEIIIVDDGSKGETAAKADEWEARYPGIVRVVHQENGGHGIAVLSGLREAQGTYYKVVDSDDWLDASALSTMLTILRGFEERDLRVDLFISNYVYEKVHEGTRTTISYRMALPRKKVFTWDDIGRFRLDQNLLMHSLCYRTDVLRANELPMPPHTFYVDNIYAYVPLPRCKTMYYADIDLYRYFIGREGQSVNEATMVKRLDQQYRITRIMMESYHLYEDVPQEKLRST